MREKVLFYLKIIILQFLYKGDKDLCRRGREGNGPDENLKNRNMTDIFFIF